MMEEIKAVKNILLQLLIGKRKGEDDGGDRSS
jgi:hypothetical protein